jgi:hypothetical protein
VKLGSRLDALIIQAEARHAVRQLKLPSSKMQYAAATGSGLPPHTYA